MAEEDKSLRCERKFVLKTPIQEIELLIKNHPLFFKEAYKERAINNIYLDTTELESYQNNIDGNQQRAKIRVRWYGELFGLIKPVLEVKIRSGNLGKKLFFPIKGFVLKKGFKQNSIMEIISKSEIPSWLKEKLSLYKPSLLNTYKRKYFISADKLFRITLDKEMEFFRIKSKKNSFIEKFSEENISILELKYSASLENKAHTVTQHFPFRLTKSSKYISGINYLLE